MPGPKPSSGSSSYSAGQASYVLDRLIAERRISQYDVNRYIAEMGREISELEARLQRLREAHGGAGGSGMASAPARRGPGRPPARAAAPAPAAAAAPGRRRRSKITAEQLASRQLQGRYLALVRQFPANRRLAFAKIAKEKGREAAIREMQDSLKK